MMIHFVYSDDLSSISELAHSMFVDRAKQFKNRLRWAVSVDELGEERDEYDKHNPLYVIVANKQGFHEASMRLLPTVGPTMINDYFTDITEGVSIKSPLIWECTRFCVSPDALPNAATKLMAAGGKVMQELLVEHFVGVFDRKMMPVYRLVGSVPTIIGWSQSISSKIGVGLWKYSHSDYKRLLDKCGLLPVEMELYFANSGLAVTGPQSSNDLAA